MAVTTTPRKFTAGHFAFMRAVVQGIDLSASWDRYLRTEGEHEDLRKVRSTIARMRSEFAAAARRHARPGTARLILVEADDVQEASGLPSLAAFAAERGLEDYSEVEQQAAFVEAYGPGTDAERKSRRARLIRRQLEALQWLERLVAQDPGPNDGVAAWFAPSIAARLEKAKLRILADLVGRINGVGARWWTSVPGVGELKAARILDWLRLYEPSIGVRIGSHVAVPRAQLQSAQLAKVVARATAIVPFEKFLLPAELDGSEGRFRAPLHQCLLEAKNDYEAIAAWLATARSERYWKDATHSGLPQGSGAVAALGDPRAWRPSSLTVEDVNASAGSSPRRPRAGAGPRHHQRWSPLWRPLEGRSASGCAAAVDRDPAELVLLSGQPDYLLGNAFAGVALPREQAGPLARRGR
jgi:hypothetical protein